MDYIRKLKAGKSQVIKDVAFCTLLKGALPNSNKLISDLFSEFDQEVSRVDSTVTKDAMNNVHGDWYEWLLAIIAWNYCVMNKDAPLALLTPKITSFDIARLYNDRLYSLIQDLRLKVLQSSSVQLISSNPDFVVIDRKVVDSVFMVNSPIHEISTDTINFIQNLYRSVSNMCGFDDIKSYVSVKTSLRPDRRLQISHEGSLMKAIYTHLQTREWIISPKGLKYYAISTKVGDSDRSALKTVATHSITTVHSIPQAAVDEVFKVNSLLEARAAFSQILPTS